MVLCLLLHVQFARDKFVHKNRWSMSLPMHTQYIHFGNLFPVLSGQKQPKPNNKNDTNENKKFNTMANDVITEWKKIAVCLFAVSFVVKCVVVVRFSVKLSQTAEILTALITDSMALRSTIAIPNEKFELRTLTEINNLLLNIYRLHWCWRERVTVLFPSLSHSCKFAIFNMK